MILIYIYIEIDRYRERERLDNDVQASQRPTGVVLHCPLQDLPELSLACFPHGSELDHESSLLALPNGNKIGKAVEASSTSRFVVFEGQKLDTP